MINRKDIQNIESLFMLSIIDEYQSKRKAAEALGSSVDTLNKYIKNLEAELGFHLVACSGQGCKLTLKGREVLQNASQIKDILFNVYNKKVKSPKPSITVRVGMDIGICANLVLCNIDKFFCRFPNIRIQNIIFQENMTLQYHDLDIGISHNEPTEKGITVLAVKDIECNLFASREYLSRHGHPHNIADIIKNHRLVYKEGLQYNNKQYEEILQNSQNICYSSNSNGMIIDAVRNNAGICVMPTCFADNDLICLDIFENKCHIPLYLSCHKKIKDQPRILAVTDYFKEVFNTI